MDETSDSLKKTLERNHIYSTAPKCPFCGGTMLPLKYLADADNNPLMTSSVWLPDDISGKLRACDDCGIVKFYPDKE